MLLHGVFTFPGGQTRSHNVADKIKTLPTTSNMHPLRRLFNHARQYRRDAWIASIYSLLNKIFDILPEILIGLAVDVVVNQKASFLAGLGIVEPRD